MKRQGLQRCGGLDDTLVRLSFVDGRPRRSGPFDDDVAAFVREHGPDVWQVRCFICFDAVNANVSVVPSVPYVGDDREVQLQNVINRFYLFDFFFFGDGRRM